MNKKTIILLAPLILQGCPDSFSRRDNSDTQYFSDASDCYQSSLRKEQVKVPTGRSMTTIEVPIANNASAFNTCMDYKGHPRATVDPSSYMDVARSCMQASRQSENPDQAYADCVRHGKITVEVLTEEKPSNP